MSKLQTSEIADLAVTVAKLASLTLANLNSKVSDATLAGIAALNTWTRKQTFSPSVNETASESHGYDTAVKSEAGGIGHTVTGGDATQGFGGNALEATGGDGQSGQDGTGLKGTGGGTNGIGMHGISPSDTEAGLKAESTNGGPALELVPVDADPAALVDGLVITTSASHPEGGSRLRVVSKDFKAATSWQNADLGGIYDAKGKYELQTLNNTATQIAFRTVGPNESTVSMRFMILARQKTTDDTAKYIIEALFNRNASNVVTNLEFVFKHTYEDQAAWNVTHTIDGTTIRINVVGETSKTIDWMFLGEYVELNSP